LELRGENYEILLKKGALQFEIPGEERVMVRGTVVGMTGLSEQMARVETIMA